MSQIYSPDIVELLSILYKSIKSVRSEIQKALQVQNGFIC